MPPQDTQEQAPPDAVERAARTIHLERTGLEMDSRCYDGDPVGHSCWTLARAALAAAGPTVEQVAEAMRAHWPSIVYREYTCGGCDFHTTGGKALDFARHQAEQVVALWREVTP